MVAKGVVLFFVGCCILQMATATQDRVGGGCWLFNPCRDGLSCHPFVQKCYHSPRRADEPCSAGYGCGSNLQCEAGAHVCRRYGQSGDPCHATRKCANGLSCHPGVHKCYHTPRRENEPCVAGHECGNGLVCEAGSQVCLKVGKFEDPCHATRPCGEGLSCQPGVHKCYHSPRRINEPCAAGFECGGGDALKCQPFLQKCLPGEFNIYNKHTCRAMKDENLARGAKDTKSAMTYGGAYTIAAGTAEVLEFGVAYGPKGEFGCYKTKCTGVVTDLSVSAGFAHTTFSKFDNIPGKSYVVGAGASIPFTEVGGFSTGSVVSDSGDVIGHTSSVTVGVGIVPAQGAFFECNTELGRA